MQQQRAMLNSGRQTVWPPDQANNPLTDRQTDRLKDSQSDRQSNYNKSFILLYVNY